MADNFCYSVLKTATLQIIQSAGFESAYREPVETLTDVVGNYIESLGSMVSSYANLSGRTTGTAWDVMLAMLDQEGALEPQVLKHWLEEEGKALAPCWSAQSDPSRILQGIVRGGRPNDEAIEYLYGTSSLPEFDTLEGMDSEQEEPEPEEEEELMDEREEKQRKDALLLPDYIPKYFPPFPEIVDESTTLTTELNLFLQEKQQQQQQQQQQNSTLIPVSSSPSSSSSNTNANTATELLPPPVIVKKKKKPIENPFTFIVPFEESDLGTATTTTTTITTAEDQANTPLSLSFTPSFSLSKKHIGKRTTSDVSPDNDDPLLSALQTIKKPKYKLGQGLIGVGDQVFQIQTQKAAAPGNNLFNRDIGTFDDIVRSIAPPLVVSKLSTPNLYMDMLGLSTPSTPSGTTAPNNTLVIHTGQLLQQQQQSQHDSFSVPSSPQNTSSTVTSPSSETMSTPKLTKSSSMLAALANGPTTPTSATNITTATTINTTTTTTTATTNTKKQINGVKKSKKDPSEPKIPKTPKTPKTPRVPKVPKLTKAEKAAMAAAAASADSLSITSDPTIIIPTTSVAGSLPGPSTPIPEHPVPMKKAKLPTTIAGKAHSNSILTSPNTTSSISSSPPSSSSSSSLSISTSKTTIPKQQSITLVQSPMIPSPTPISLNALSSNTKNSNLKKDQLTPEQLQQLKLQKQQQKLQRQQLKQQQQLKLKQQQQQAGSSSSHIQELKNTPGNSHSNGIAGGEKKKKMPKLMLNISQPSTPIHSGMGDSPSTPKIRFKVNAPSPIVEQPQQQQSTGSEVIRCLCENPTVDYGTFMIACDHCSVWFHGSCVGIAEDDQVEEWYCRRCRA